MVSQVVKFAGLSNRDLKKMASMPRLAAGDRMELHVRRRVGREQTLALPPVAADAVATLIDRLLSGDRVVVLAEDQELSPTEIFPHSWNHPSAHCAADGSRRPSFPICRQTSPRLAQGCAGAESPSVLTTNIDLDEGTCSIDLLEAASGYFGLGMAAARAVIKEVAVMTATWWEIAKEVGVHPADITRISSAFEHDDLRRALVL